MSDITYKNKDKKTERFTKKSTSLSSLSLFSMLALASPALFAAGPQLPNFNLPDSLRDTRPPELPQQKTPPVPLILQQEEKPMSLADGEKIDIRDFKVEGAEFVDQTAVSALLEPYRNRQLTMSEINEAANQVTVYCRQQGYLVARAYVPKQDAKDGVLLIKVVAGKYGKFQLENNSLVNSERLQAMFDNVGKDSPVVHGASIERAMLLIADMPGAALPLVTIAPGSEPETSDFAVDVESPGRISGYVAADNYGSRIVGENRLFAGVDINSPLGIGDRLSLAGMTSKAAGLQSGRVAYSFPLSNNGLRGEVSALRSTDKLGAEYADLNVTGRENALHAMLSYPLKRTENDSIYLSLDLAGKRIGSNIAAFGFAVDERAKVATLSLHRETFGSLLGYNTYANVTGALTVGRLDIDDESQRALNQAGANTVGNYSKANVSFNGSIAFSAVWKFEATAQVQQALGRNLDGTEQLNVSGSGGIKSYPDGVTSDNGYVLGGELKYALPSLEKIDHAVGMFADYGAVRPQDGRYTTVGEIRVGDVGVAYHFSRNNLSGRVDLARTVGSQQETSIYNDKWKLQASVGMRF